MVNKSPAELIAEKINTLSGFKKDIRCWFDGNSDPRKEEELRSRINRTVRRVREIIREAGCLKLITLAPPPAVGGLVVQNADPFASVLESYYGMSLIPMVSDMIDETVGVLESPEYLEQMLARSQDTEAGLEQERLTVKSLQRVLTICRRFPLVARQLQDRHAVRATLVIEDEYDVQDLFRALLRLDFDDVRAEEWTPSYAGKSARVDFLLKRESLVIEIKKTRNTLGAKEVGDQLLVDIGRYKAHPSCKSLVCFVYDPEFRIGNPAELEDDLSGLHDRLDVRVVVAPGNA